MTDSVDDKSVIFDGYNLDCTINPFNPSSSNPCAFILWKIEKYSDMTEPLRSKMFVTREQLKSDDSKKQPEKTTFRLIFNPMTKKYTDFAIRRVDNFNNTITARCRFSIIDVSGKQCLTQDCITKFRGKSCTNGIFFLSREYILDPQSGLLKDDALTIFCEIEILDENFDKSSKHLQLMATSKALQDYASLLDRPKFADVLLVVGKDPAKKDFHVHMGILTARSPVFGAMFEHRNTRETEESRLEITDVSADAFEQFIRFVYTGNVTQMDKYAQDLFILSDKYQMDCLKTLCWHHLSSQLTTELVSSILVLADVHKAAELKSNCIDYIVDHAEQVMATKQFSENVKNKPELMFELFEKQSIKRFKV